MDDHEELKARSIELAERALRLRDRAQNDTAKEALHAAANELIMLDNPNRFYAAQSELEKHNEWLEDQRSLAHEINVADRTIRNSGRLDPMTNLKRLEDWARVYTDSANEEVAATGAALNNSLEVLKAAENKHSQKEALNYIISVIEAILEHIVTDDSIVTSGNNTVLILRIMRDSALVIRELSYDEDELLANYKEEGETIARLTVARHTIDELYKTAQS